MSEKPKNKQGGWSSSEEEDIILDSKPSNSMISKRLKMEKIQENEPAWHEGTTRKRDEWDSAYDSGK